MQKVFPLNGVFMDRLDDVISDIDICLQQALNTIFKHGQGMSNLPWLWRDIQNIFSKLWGLGPQLFFWMPPVVLEAPN